MTDSEREALAWARRVLPHPDERAYWSRLVREYGVESPLGLRLTQALGMLALEELKEVK